MNLLDRFFLRRELATQRRWRDNAYTDWHQQLTAADKADLARRLVDRLRTIAELEERLRDD